MFELSLGTRILIFIIGMPLGFFFLLKPLFIVNSIGKSAWAEQNLPGGTYGAVKLLGIAVIVIALILLLNF